MSRISLYLFLVLQLFVSIGQATPPSDYALDALLNLEGDRMGIVNGVNVLSGDFIDSQIDMVIPGPEPLTLRRSYHGNCWARVHGEDHRFWPTMLFDGWTIHHGGFVYCDERGIHAKEPNGVCLLYQDSADPFYYPVAESVYKRGVTNTSAGVISGRTNLKNNKFEKNSIHAPNINAWKQIKGNGGIKLYRKSKTDRMFLELDRRPSGISVEYDYCSWKDDGFLRSVKLLNDNHQLYGQFVFTYEDAKKHHRTIKVHSSGNEWVQYDFEKQYKYFLLTEVTRSNGPTEKYSYNRHKLVRKDIGSRRFKEIDYYKEKKNGDYHAARKGRVSELREPVGSGENAITSYRFKYHENVTYREISATEHEVDKLLEGVATVLDAYDNKTDYIYDSNYRLKNIYKHHGPHIFRWDSFHWGHGQDISNLVSKVIRDGAGNALACRYLIYDAAGNITDDKIFGNLTGFPQVPLIVTEGNPHPNGCEFYQKIATYSDDGFNLPIVQADCRTIELSGYYAGSNRLMYHITLDAGQNTKRRKFLKYDGCHAVCREIVDDGTARPNKGDVIDNIIDDMTNVTERYEKIIVNSAPGQGIPVGLPLTVEEYVHDLKLGRRLLVKKIRNVYDARGLLYAQEHYDSLGAHRYTLLWEYDYQGNCVKETNALGHSIYRSYDEYGNKISELGPSLAFAYFYSYDCMNRLTSEELRYFNQHSNMNFKSLFTRHTYDYLNRRTSTTDCYGHTTQFAYDPSGNVIQTTHPLIKTENDKIHPISYAKYDALNRPVEKTDPNLNTTRYAYTLRGQPCYIEYPDGSKEHMIYTLDGYLDRKIEKNGVVTQYYYDHKGRVIRKETKGPSGEFLTTTSATYNEFHLLSETDPAGNITLYDYEFGRLSAKTKGDEKETYHYDELGHLIETRYYYGLGSTDYVAERKEFDYLGRVILEETRDASGQITSKVAYELDKRGNPVIVKTYLDEENYSQTFTGYDAFNRPLDSLDAEGNLTKHCYYIYGGNLVREIVDPMGSRFFTQYDYAGRVSKESRFNAFTQCLQSHEYYFTANGNPLITIDEVYQNDIVDKKIRTQYLHDSMSQLIIMAEACGTPEERTTKHQYNLYGEKTKTTKPDGSEICYQYDALGRVIKYNDTLATFAYEYTYDDNSNVIAVWDEIHHCATTKTYDQNDRLVVENLANGLSMQYSYDGMGRGRQTILPDQSIIDYRYEGELLRQVSKRNQNGDILYSHAYLNYDLAGKLLQSQLVGNAGQLDFSYDILSRPKQIKSSQWQETISRYDKVGNLLERSITDSQGTFDCKYAYDQLYQLSEERGVQTHTYQHDSVYNRRKKDDYQHTVNHLNQLQDDGKNAYRYDKNGNLIEKTSKNEAIVFEYDGLDRLIKVTKNGDEICYQYDDLNRRLYKTSLYDNVRYLYQGQNEIGSCDAQGHWLECRTLGIGLGAEIGAAIAIELQGKVYVPIHDSNGNVMTLLDADTGDVCESYRYTAYGEETTPDSTLNPWRFSSKRKDSETGFVYFGRRYYSPEIGKFVTADPLGYDAGPNLYAYVLNNPLTHFDLYGLVDNATEAVMEMMLNEYYNSGLRDSSESQPSIDHSLDTREERSGGFWSDCLQGAVEGYAHPIDSGMNLASCAMNEDSRRSQSAGRIVGQVIGVAATIATWWSPFRLGLAAGTAIVKGCTHMVAKKAAASACQKNMITYAGAEATGAAAAKNVARAEVSGLAKKQVTTDLVYTEVQAGKQTLKGWTDLKPTLERISQGIKHPHKNDGSIFKNNRSKLPIQQEGYYREYVHPTPGIQHAGLQRIVRGEQGEMFYSRDHYESFIRIK